MAKLNLTSMSYSRFSSNWSFIWWVVLWITCKDHLYVLSTRNNYTSQVLGLCCSCNSISVKWYAWNPSLVACIWLTFFKRKNFMFFSAYRKLIHKYSRNCVCTLYPATPCQGFIRNHEALDLSFGFYFWLVTEFYLIIVSLYYWCN